ncbi:MAG TPA: glycosyltransferase [Gammaproteobacteria bacterium]|nr:glycosyltransferase [Gammaproteobacteria bacterium]MDP7297117.1 glycosyltransferase [Gammaproteobacteria bacterium]HJP39532.1 glycosyltransferase [Gammaproteobacteria bacterium]
MGKPVMSVDNPPLVTVVIPAYNEAETIAAAINSVMQQSFTNFELLVIDDGSTDDTAEISAAIADPRVQVLSFDNQGLAASRNRGIRHATGELIAFLDADDLWTPNKLHSQVEALQQHPEAKLAYSWTDCIDEDNRFLRHGSHVHAEGLVYKLLLSRNFMDNGSSPMVRKSAFDEAGVFDESYRAGEDWDMWLRLAHRYPFTCVPFVQVLYRIRKTSMMSDVSQQFECVTSILRKGLKRLPASPEREHIKRAATANIHKYLSLRLIETGDTRRHGIQAGRHWRLYITTTPTLFHRFDKTLFIGSTILLMVILPPTLFAWLRKHAVVFNHLRTQTITPDSR